MLDDLAANDCTANSAPISSSSLICFFVSAAVKDPLVLTPLQQAPQPKSEASVYISRSGTFGKNNLSRSTFKLEIHYCKSSRAPAETSPSRSTNIKPLHTSEMCLGKGNCWDGPQSIASADSHMDLTANALADGRAKESRQESNISPKYSKFWVGSATVFSQFMRKPSCSSKSITCLKSFAAPYFDRFKIRISSR
ncbi:hypothetical protein OUZ56_010163 [Daphnia magna]|uniref:Uncharacterized protein n=1 Tax=Daphnia magna TaxID=35525 RepID=A0ABR0AI49_9CRUS|nr:hypothetical protein OUZ56_010163 [Daphnia magna]